MRPRNAISRVADGVGPSIPPRAAVASRQPFSEHTMTAQRDPFVIRSLAELSAMFGPVGEVSIRKETTFVTPEYAAMIGASPFVVLATAGPEGLDASPRGDPPGFVVVDDEHTLLLPERPGNNRIDSLRNLLADPRVALLFLIPGIGETLRVVGRAEISVDPALLGRFVVNGRLPKCVLRISVERVFFQCARATHRSRLWTPAADGSGPNVPSAGTILAAITDSAIDAAAYDRDLPARHRETLY